MSVSNPINISFMFVSTSLCFLRSLSSLSTYLCLVKPIMSTYSDYAGYNLYQSHLPNILYYETRDPIMTTLELSLGLQ